MAEIRPVMEAGISRPSNVLVHAVISSAMKLRLVIEFDPEVKRWSAVFPELPGCASAGDTEEEAVANAREALALLV